VDVSLKIFIRAMLQPGTRHGEARHEKAVASPRPVPGSTVPEGFRHPVNGYVGLHMMHRAL
jgi:hypothetical protein